MDEIAFIEGLLPKLKQLNNPEYKQGRFRIYRDYIEQSEIPVSYQYIMQPNPFYKMPQFSKDDVKDFVNNIGDYLDCEFNCVFNFPTYIGTDKLSAYIIQNYIRNYLENDGAIKKIIYIDTPLLMTDLKRYISYSSGNDTGLERAFVHRIDTVNKGVEDADFVIWDKMTNISSDYDRAELYRILSIRHKRGLGNLFYISGGRKNAIGTLGVQVTDMFYGVGMIDFE